MDAKFELYGTNSEITDFLNNAQRGSTINGLITYPIRKIPAIKFVRNETGMSLVDSKRFVERMIELSTI